MSNYEPMETDHRQTLLGLNQGNELERLISDVMNHKVSPTALAESRELVKLGNALECLKDTLRSTSRTAKLWLRFMDYIEIIKDFICCERLGMWDGHLNAVTALLNLFAATCHIHYAKSARLYVQEMRKLPSTHPWLHQKFVEGYHTVRRSERLGGNVDRHSDRASSDEVSEKPWWSYKRQKVCGNSGCTACTLVLQFMMQ